MRLKGGKNENTHAGQIFICLRINIYHVKYYEEKYVAFFDCF